MSPRLGTHIQASIQAATSPAGCAPGTATRVYIVYSPQKWITPHSNPVVQKSHPIGHAAGDYCADRREAYC
jgi:hypothetical protein